MPETCDVVVLHVPPVPPPPVTLMVMGDEPMAVNPLHETVPEHATEVVAMLESALVPLPYKSCEEVRDETPVPPYVTPTLLVPTMVPEEFVVSTVEGTWKRVVLPTLLTAKRVEVAKEAVEEEMTKRFPVEPLVVEVAKRESMA